MTAAENEHEAAVSSLSNPPFLGNLVTNCQNEASPYALEYAHYESIKPELQSRVLKLTRHVYLDPLIEVATEQLKTEAKFIAQEALDGLLERVGISDAEEGAALSRQLDPVGGLFDPSTASIDGMEEDSWYHMIWMEKLTKSGVYIGTRNTPSGSDAFDALSNGDKLKSLMKEMVEGAYLGIKGRGLDGDLRWAVEYSRNYLGEPTDLFPTANEAKGHFTLDATLDRPLDVFPCLQNNLISSTLSGSVSHCLGNGQTQASIYLTVEIIFGPN